MPEVAANSLEAVVASWKVGLNTPYAAGEAIVTVETEKAVVDVEAEEDGVLLRTLVDEGANVEVGRAIAVWGTGQESEADVDQFLSSLGIGRQPAVGGGTVAGADEPEADSSVAADSPAPDNLEPADVPGAATVVRPESPGDGRSNDAAAPPRAAADAVAGPATCDTSAGPPRLFASPLARRIAKESGLDLGRISGSGPRGRILRRDVEAAADQPPGLTEEPPTASPDPVKAPANSQTAGSALEAGDQPAFRDVPVSRMRAAIARRLTESKQSAPHFYVRGSARVDRLLSLRSEINEGGAVKVSVNHLLVKAVARAHALVPELNVQWQGDSIRHFNDVDVAIAVATEHGLVTPVLRDVDWLPLQQLVETSQDLIARAKNRQLQQAELEGGSISVSNLGAYGTEEFSPILNPPQASILAVGAVREEPVVEDGALCIGKVLRVTLAADHRPVDGVNAAQWMRTFVRLLEHPAQILM